MTRFLAFNAERIDILLGIPAMRPVWKYGVEINGRQRYNSDALQEIRGKLGVAANGKSLENVKLKAFDRDIGYIYAYQYWTQEWVKVLHPRQDYAAGTHIHIHRILMRIAKIDHRADPEYDKLLLARETLNLELAKLRQSASLRDRKAFAHLSGEPARQAAGAGATPALPPTSAPVPPKSEQPAPIQTKGTRKPKETEIEMEIEPFESFEVFRSRAK